MPTDKDRLGNAVIDDLKAAGFYSPDATPADEAKSRAQWKVIANAILRELKVNQDIVLAPGDIPVDPGTFTTPSGAVTGIGVSEAVTLTGKTQ